MGSPLNRRCGRRASPMFIQGPVWTPGCVVLPFLQDLSCWLWCLASGKKFYKFYASDNAGVNGHGQLVGGLEHFLCFHILGRITPTDFHIFQRGLKPPTSQHVVVCSRMHEIPLQPTSDGQSKSTPKLPNLDLWGQHLAVGCVVQSLGTRSGPGGWESDQIRLGGALYRRRKSRRSIGAGKMMKNASLVMIGYG